MDFFRKSLLSFIEFSLYVSGDPDSIRLELTGSDEVKNLLKEEFQLA